jgi:hypothetical protein
LHLLVNGIMISSFLEKDYSIVIKHPPHVKHK